MSAARPLDIVIFGLSITSAWGNGHATTYRALVRALAARGHRVRFFERDVPWYAEHRDLPHPCGCTTQLYGSLAELERHFGGELDADLVMLGSYVPEGIRLAEWLLQRATGLTAFYDIDTPVTEAGLARGACEYLTLPLVPRFDLYLSFAGGPVLERLRKRYRARCVRPLYCSVDPQAYYPSELPERYALGYLGTYSADRQRALEALLVEPARRLAAERFCVAGPQYPPAIEWPANVERIDHLPPHRHRDFYCSQRFTLNVTRADMVANGFAPSVRLFEAAACGVPVISDEWHGIEEFFRPGEEILIARSPEESLRMLCGINRAEAAGIGAAARARVLSAHTSMHRALELETWMREASTAVAC